jgi:mono/diheme cytochrome c family protein
MSVRHALLLGVALLFVPSVKADRQITADQPPSLPTSLASGKQLYQQYCAACHGADAKGHGPAADTLKRPPTNLTTLAIRHGGKFPYDYVSSVLLFGPGNPAHGSAVMPTWGFIFRYLDTQNEAAVRQRINNLSGYLLYLQVRQTLSRGQPPSAH